jgi:flagellum-specific ATP synthase
LATDHGSGAWVLERLRRLDAPSVEGRVSGVVGLTIEAERLPAAVGDHCTILGERGKVAAEVVAFRNGRTVLMPYHDATGVAAGCRVTSRCQSLRVPVGVGLLGRVVDGLGHPLDGKGPLIGSLRAVIGTRSRPLERMAAAHMLHTRIPVLDGLLSLAKGQRLGIFAGSGVGKSTLLGRIARDSTAEVNVIALIGERNREVLAFLDEVLGPEGLAKSVVVVATGDAPPMLRLLGPELAATIAESFREAGRDVLLVMDSVTRYAFAAREVGLAAGEPPTLRGYPPSLFARLPRLLERFGTWANGSITALCTVLMEGDELDDPLADALRGLLDGHVVLSRRLAAMGKFPPVDVPASISRVMSAVVGREHRQLAQRLRGQIALHEEHRDLVHVGAYKSGSLPALDAALRRREAIDRFLYTDQPCELAATLAAMHGLTQP